MKTTYTLPLDSPQADLLTVGGKGASLARLLTAGFPIPNGFHVTTVAYRQFVTANHLQPQILQALRSVDPTQPQTLETASEEIYRLFTNAEIPVEIVNAVIEAYRALSGEFPRSPCVHPQLRRTCLMHPLQGSRKPILTCVVPKMFWQP